VDVCSHYGQAGSEDRWKVPPWQASHRLSDREGKKTLRLGFFSTLRAATKGLLSITFARNPAIFPPYSMGKWKFFKKPSLDARQDGRLVT